MKFIDWPNFRKNVRKRQIPRLIEKKKKFNSVIVNKLGFKKLKFFN